MPLAPSIAFGLFMACQAGLVAAGAHRLRLLLVRRRRRVHPSPRGSATLLPRVTVQLPIHNERHVVRRVIDAVVAFEYPRELLEIQVLDDSTDETHAEAERCAKVARALGARVSVLHRARRDGYKAGALAAGLRDCRGEFVAIFDADFVPPADFLTRALPAFADPGVGMVQARWGHVNEPYSVLTRVQAAFLDAHFLLEHPARAAAGAFFNFNGTAGVWRKSAIVDAGGWQADTLTEDLDLSYRAQLRGWRFVFLEDLVAPAELPSQMSAFKSQQYRWARGSLQTARKLLGRVWREPLPLATRIEACFHLAGNLSYLFALVPALLMLPLMEIPDRGNQGTPVWLAGTFALTSGAFLAFFSATLVRRRRGGLRQWLTVPAMWMVGIGLSLNNSRAVLAGLFGGRGEFRRTPKLGGVGSARPGTGPTYAIRPDPWGLAELALSAYFAGSAWIAHQLGREAATAFLVLFCAGFAYVGGLTTWEWLTQAISPGFRPTGSEVPTNPVDKTFSLADAFRELPH